MASTASTEPTVHVDLVGGNDSTGDGSASAPYLTASHVLLKHGASPVNILVRKAAGEEYAEITKSALKTARKEADGIEKKRKRAEELAARDAEKEAAAKEKKAKQLDEARKVVLEDDPKLQAATKVRVLPSTAVDARLTRRQAKIRNLTPLRDQRVRVSGWVHRLRDQKDIIFIVLRDGTGYLQAVLSGRVVR